MHGYKNYCYTAIKAKHCKLSPQAGVSVKHIIHCRELIPDPISRNKDMTMHLNSSKD